MIVEKKKVFLNERRDDKGTVYDNNDGINWHIQNKTVLRKRLTNTFKPVSHLWLIPCSFHNEVKYGFSLKVFQNDAAQVREYLCQIVANIFHIQLASRTHAYKCKCKHRDICTG